MKNFISKRAQYSVTFILLASIAFGLASSVLGQTDRDANRAKADAIKQNAGNGIHVDLPKVYDDTALQLMLQAARQRLAALQTFDQTALTSRIGAVTGASLDQQAFSAQVLGPSIPGSTVTSNGATGSTSIVNAPAGQTTTTQAGQPVQNVTTVNPQVNSSAPGLPTLGATLPSSGYNISSIDALGEMMQLTYEIANLQLLLEGSLSDRYVADKRITKPRTTLGFSISIATQERYKDAVAMVEVDAEKPGSDTFSDEKPGVTALLPREKTYNVAAITDNMTQVGGGFVSQVISGGASFLRGRKTYYLVQDQDTLALMRPAKDGVSAFSWQFRPVLGQRFVKSGLKQTFVQLAVPISAQAKSFGKVRVRTYWQKFDRKKGVLKEIIPDSINDSYAEYSIPVFNSRPKIERINPVDLGNGLIQTALEGRFLAGTYVRVGPNIYREGSPGFTAEMTQIRFTANASDIAQQGAFLGTRDGTETPIQRMLEPDVKCECEADGNAIKKVTSPSAATNSVSAFDATNSLITVNVTRPTGVYPPTEDYMIMINGRVYGLNDAPIERSVSGNTLVLRAIVPNNVLLAGSRISAKPMFWNSLFEASATQQFNLENTADKIVLLGPVAGGKLRYILYGSRLASIKIIIPEGVVPGIFEGYTNTSAVRTFDLTPDDAKSLKQIALIKGPAERPVFVAMPTPEAKPSVSFKDRVAVGMNEIVVSGEPLDKLKAVKFKGNNVTFTVAGDKKTVTLSNLLQVGVTAIADLVKLEFDFGDAGKVSLGLEVVSGKIELVTRN